jgi:acyl-CoA synthetase (AMP-forming)/AMP-acid ligase II
MRAELGFETIVTGYGLTEATGIATMCRHDDDPETIATTSGRAIPDVEVLVVDENTVEVPRGEPGEVVIRGYNIMRGFIHDPEATAEAIDADGWLHTGDVGALDENGYLSITDRLKDMYISGGFNVYPAEVEQALARLDGVAEAAVVGVPDERLGEVGVARVVPNAELDTDTVLAFCRERLANYKIPRRVEFRDSLPRNPSGKVLKTTLREELIS